jgi:RNA polymerase sigma-70 factor (ECF subfamily)
MVEALEEEIRRLFDAGDLDRAATKTIEGYGGEVFAFLVAILRDEDAASDVFAQLSEDLWKGFAGFEWRCSMRTWFYTLARHASARHRRCPHNQPRRHQRLSRMSEIAERVRSQTRPFLRTEVKDKFAELRATLDPDDQALLILRVNRKLAWNDIARIMMENDEPHPEDLERAAARLRQQFQGVKQAVRELARERGLLDED